jgi:hypothetical protein
VPKVATDHSGSVESEVRCCPRRRSPADAHPLSSSGTTFRGIYFGGRVRPRTSSWSGCFVTWSVWRLSCGTEWRSQMSSTLRRLREHLLTPVPVQMAERR